MGSRLHQQARSHSGLATHSTPSTGRVSKSVLSTAHSPQDRGETPSMVGGYFPYRLTATLAALKVVSGCLLVGLGAAAMVQQAGYSRQATGIWGGIVVTISGVLGAYTVRTGALHGAVAGFLASSVLSLVASVVVVIYSATGLARDAAQPYGLRRDEAGHLVAWGEGVMPSREAAMLTNTLLIIMGVLDVIFSLPSVIIGLRELCQCYNPLLLAPPPAPPPRKPDLMAWLGQQPSSGIFYSHGSGVPYRPMPAYPRASPPFLHIPSEASAPGGRPSPRGRGPEGPGHRAPPRHRSKSPGPRHHHAVHTHRPPGLLAPFPSYPAMDLWYPPPPSQLSQPMMPAPFHYPVQHPGWLYGPDWEAAAFPSQHAEDQARVQRREERRRHKEHRDQRKRSRSKSQPRDSGPQGGHRQKRQKGPTDSDIERSYTGMDRDLAEEFIEQTMDPAVLVDQTMSGTESEAW
jgi:hypothetical protein